MIAKKTAIHCCLVIVGLMAACGTSWAEGEAASGTPVFSPPPIAKLIAGSIGRLLVLRSELNISPDQRQKVAAILKDHRQEIRPVAQAVLEKRRALRETVLASPRDEKAIRKAAEALGKAIGDAALAASKVVAEARPVLTPDQIEQIRRFRESNTRAENSWLQEIGK